ncbi:hypothetical protein Glove_633g4 [Diversispora epigaea]|uniref:Uncharacterized protein n=1 Tax=Diversispora epigaea TaxID=1348612 RepID=A0A397G7Z4_9GLOM|nr:hypothetical protein Glove_633g4 [Diversispora epigaea]
MQKQLMISINKEIGGWSRNIKKNEDVIKAFADFTKDFGSIVAIPPILSFIHPEVHTQVSTLPLRLGWNPIGKHMITLKLHLKPVLQKRLKDKEILGDKNEPPLDIVEYLMNKPEYETKVITDDYLKKICEFLFIIVVASIHTTSSSITYALHDFAGRPEIWNVLCYF